MKIKKNMVISFQSIFYYIVLIGFLFPRGYNGINPEYHIICSALMWIAVMMTCIQCLTFIKAKHYRQGKQVDITILFISGYFIMALLITAVCRRDFSSGLQQLFAAPAVCVFMISNLKRDPEKLLNIIINIFCIEFTVNALICHPYLKGIYHTIFLGHVQVVSQVGIISLLVGTYFWIRYHSHKIKIIYFYVITFYTMLTTDAEAAVLTLVGLLIAFVVYKLKFSQLFKFKSEIYIICMIILSVLVVYFAAIDMSMFPGFDINGRRYVWQSALFEIAKNPILGYGIDGVQLSTFWTSGFNYAHNQLMQNLLDGGIVLAVFFWLMIFGFSSKINHIQISKYRVLCNASLLVLLFVMLVESTTLYIYMYMILAINYVMADLTNPLNMVRRDNCGNY